MSVPGGGVAGGEIDRTVTNSKVSSRTVVKSDEAVN